MDNCERIDWTEISNRGLLVRINTEIMHPLGLAVYRDPETGVSGGALVSPDGKFEYEGVSPESEVTRLMKDRGPWVEVFVGAYGLVAVTEASAEVQQLFLGDMLNMLELVKEIRTRFFSDRKGNPRPPVHSRYLITLEAQWETVGKSVLKPAGWRAIP